MANKKYNEFSDGAYDPAKIFLQADATTGALEKLLLPLIGKYKIFAIEVDTHSGGTADIYETVNQFGGTLSVSNTGTGSWKVQCSNDLNWDYGLQFGALLMVDSSNNNAVLNTFNVDGFEFKTFGPGASSPSNIESIIQFFFFVFP